MQLRLCGRPFGPEAAAALVGGGALSGLVSLELGGAYRLTDQPLLDGTHLPRDTHLAAALLWITVQRSFRAAFSRNQDRSRRENLLKGLRALQAQCARRFRRCRGFGRTTRDRSVEDWYWYHSNTLSDVVYVNTQTYH